MKETAEAYLGHKVTHTVITVPACKLLSPHILINYASLPDFNEGQRQATKESGCRHDRWSTGSSYYQTAAAIAYGLNKKTQIIVYGLGGGTFNVSLLSIDDGVFEVLATAVTRVLEAKISTTELWNMCDVSKNKRRLSAKSFLSVAPRIPKVQQLLKEYFGGKEPSK